MRTLSITGLALAGLLFSCASPEFAADISDWQLEGAEISDEAPISIADLLATPDKYDGQNVLVEGTIAQACVKKGCWMILESGEESVRVTFKDYGFFVPTDSAGRTARFEGQFQLTEISEADARHYAEDAGDMEAAAAINGPQKEFSIVATGVRLR